MSRVNILASHDGGAVAGWFDYGKRLGEWTDMDHDGNGSRGAGRGTGVILTSGGKWVSVHVTRYAAEDPAYAYITAGEARDWLIANRRDEAVAQHFGELAEEEDRRPGRPGIGDPVQVRFHPSQLARIDAYAQGNGGISRAEAIRQLTEIALLDLAGEQR